MINWRKFLGLILIFGALSELARIISNYRSGAIKSWPFGIELGLAVVILIGILLIKKGSTKNHR